MDTLARTANTFTKLHSLTYTPFAVHQTHIRMCEDEDVCACCPVTRFLLHHFYSCLCFDQVLDGLSLNGFQLVQDSKHFHSVLTFRCPASVEVVLLSYKHGKKWQLLRK